MRTPEGYKYWKISVIPGYCCSSNFGNMKSQVNMVCLYETSQQSYCSSLGTKGSLEYFQTIYKLQKFHITLKTAEEVAGDVAFYLAQTL